MAQPCAVQPPMCPALFNKMNEDNSAQAQRCLRNKRRLNLRRVTSSALDQACLEGAGSSAQGPHMAAATSESAVSLGQTNGGASGSDQLMAPCNSSSES